MSEVFFVFKTLLIAVLLIGAMQIKIGSSTVEQHSLKWMRQSSAILALRGVAESAAIVIETGYDWTKNFVDKQMGGKNSSRSRSERQPSRETGPDRD